MNSSIRFLKFWLPVIIWASLIFYLSSIPDLRTVLEYDLILRKMAHCVEYFILTFLLYRALKSSFHIRVLQLFIYPTILSFFYAISDEFHQSFVPGRSASIKDVLIDSAGIISFYIAIKIIALNHKKG